MEMELLDDQMWRNYSSRCVTDHTESCPLNFLHVYYAHYIYGEII